MPTPPTDPVDAPREPVVQPRRGISLAWILPLVAAIVGLTLFWRTLNSQGPEITISFRAATGLEAGKTPVKYKDVVVGSVRSVELSGDRSHVVATVELVKSAASLANAESRFWVVRPRIGAGGVTGVDTLLSGAYIAVDTGSTHEERKAFEGLEAPPSVINGMAGRTFVIHAADIGSLDTGSPLYYKHIPVGRVASFRLDEQGQGVTLQVFVDAPYDRFVTTDTRFWNASGVDVSLGADGLKLKTQSVATIVAGGIAFGTPPGEALKAEAADGAVFTLAADEATALAPPDGPMQQIELRFNQSLRGLAVGAPVEFLGIGYGSVTAVALDYDATTRKFATIVQAEVYPERIGRVLKRPPFKPEDSDQRIEKFVAMLVAQGLRAQAPSANLLTGQRYISIDFVPSAPKVAFDASLRPFRIPTANGDFDQIQEKMARIVDRIDKIPLDSIGRHLDSDLAQIGTTLATADKTFGAVNDQFLPQATQTLQQIRQAVGTAGSALSEDSPLQQNLGQTLHEVQRSARSLRELTDLLGRNPEALLRGRPADARPVPPGAAASTPESRP